jgi:two-component system, LytTR family, response regulator
MIRSVIVDDEPKNLRILASMLQEFCPEVQVVGKAEKHTQAIELIHAEKPDLVFLDIAMPGGDAFDLLDKLQPVEFEIIFVTAHDNYTLTAFKYSAVDYLLKPVEIEVLQAAIARAIERKNLKQNNLHQLGLLLNSLNKQQSQSVSKIALPSQEGLIFLPVSEIVRCEASGSYTHIFKTDKKKLLVSRRMSEYEELLPASLFFRIHQSHIINLDHVVKYHRGRGGFVEMSDGAMLELATRRKDEFLARFGLKG